MLLLGAYKAGKYVYDKGWWDDAFLHGEPTIAGIPKSGLTVAGGVLLAGGVAYLLGRGAAWLVDKARGKIDQEQATKVIAKAKQKLQSDPEFAAKVRKKANTLKESLRAPKGKKISVFGSMNKPKKISTKKAKKSQSVMGAIDAVSKVGGILG